MHKYNKLPAAQRMTAAQHADAAAQILGRLHKRYPLLRAESLKAYSGKQSFSGLDLLVAIPETEHAFAELRGYITSEVATGDNICDDERISLQYGQFQVDVAFVPAAHFDMAADYHAYQELGNLISKVAHARGLSLRPGRLAYRVRDGERMVADIELAHSWSRSLDILGYSHAEWQQGFTSLPDIFAFVASSPLFCPSLFPSKQMAKPGARPSLREAFATWLSTAELGTPAKDPLLWLFDQVPGFEVRYETVVANDSRKKA